LDEYGREEADLVLVGAFPPFLAICEFAIARCGLFAQQPDVALAWERELLIV
jgi:hypothetical protein